MDGGWLRTCGADYEGAGSEDEELDGAEIEALSGGRSSPRILYWCDERNFEIAVEEEHC